MFAARSAPVGNSSGVENVDLTPDGVEECWAALVGTQRVELTPADVFHRQDHRSIFDCDNGAQIGTPHTGSPSEQQEQAFMLHRPFQGHSEHVVTGLAQDEQSIAAIEPIGVPAIAGVDLDEGSGAVAKPRSIQLRSPAGRPLEGERGHRQAGLLEGHGDGTRRRSAIGRAENDEDGRSREPPGRHRQKHLGQAGGTGDEDGNGNDDEPPIDAAPPCRRQPGFADGDRGSGTSEKERRREAGGDQPEVILQCLGNASGNPEGGIEESEGANPDEGCQCEMDESAPPPPQDKGHDDERSREDGDELGNRDGQLTYRDRDEGHDVGDIVAKAGIGPFGQLDEHQQHERGKPPDDEVDHVTGMAEVALARRAVVEGCCRARRHGGRRSQTRSLMSSRPEPLQPPRGARVPLR